MKKILAGFIFLVAATAYAATQLESLNDLFTQMLAPLNVVDAATGNKVVESSVVFNKLETTATGAKDLDGTMTYKRVGATKSINLAFSGSYSNPQDGSEPVVKFSASTNTDLLLNLMGGISYEEFAADVDQSMQDFAAEGVKMAQDIIGPVDPKDVNVLTAVSKGADGKVEKIVVQFDAKVDLANLPAGVTVDSYVITSAHLFIEISPTDTTFKIGVTTNPKNKYFAQDQTGLKEWIDLLLAKDKNTIDSIGMLLGMFDDFAQKYTK